MLVHCLHIKEAGEVFQVLTRILHQRDGIFVELLFARNVVMSLLLPIGDSWFEGRERVRYTREQLLQLQEAVKVLEVPDDILKIKQDIEAELFGEDQSWGSQADSNLPHQLQNRYSEPDNRDWRGRSGQLPSNLDERSWENIRDNSSQVNRQDQIISQFARTQISSIQGGGPTPTLVKAEVPWSARRGSLSEKDRVLKTVKG
ncbi:unnamed protein product [Sphenostylis stenocarpa]|uniref:Uncharacterized protein n=1 Tax=Sphenostylis stenocarpa TaxID=92480 RepID=A0AA86VP21_9FABA|nr:unnamed protein product [Sphenostylis stenocarpa]